MKAPPFLLLAAALTAGLVITLAVLFLGGDDEVPTTNPQVSLPSPQAPVIRPLSSETGGGVGWGWVNPRPRAMPSWNDVEIGGPGLIAMVGTSGRAAKMSASDLRLWPTGVDVDLNALAFVGPTQAMAVGDDGTLVALLESGPRRVETGVEMDLRAIAALDTLSVLVVGDRGTFMRVENLQARAVDTGRSEALLGVAARGGNAFLVGARGVILRVQADDTFTIERRPGGPTLRAVGGCGADLYAAGDEGVVLRRNTERGEVSWDRIELSSTPGPDDENWTDITCDGTHAAISGAQGSVLLVADDRAVRLESPPGRGYTGIGGFEGVPPVLVGRSGNFARLRNDHLEMLSAGPSGTLFDIATLGGVVIGAGAMGLLVRESDGRVSRSESGTDAALAALVPMGEGQLMAFGDYGHVLRVFWDRVETLESPGEVGWRDAVIDEGIVLAVGTDGQLLRGTPESLRVTQIPAIGDGVLEPPTLWTVSGVPSDAIAAGDRGVVVHIGDGVRPVPCPAPAQPAGSVLRGSVQHDGWTWLVGDRGRILRTDGRQCETEREAIAGQLTLHAAGLGPHGRPIAVGDQGSALERAEDGSWQAIELGAGQVSLRAVHRTAREVYVAGAAGAILRHPY